LHKIHQMRVLIVNTSERIGGAAIAATRLMEALKRNGVKAKMVVRDKQTDHLTVISVGSRWLQPVRFCWERLVIFMANKFSRRNLFQLDIANTGTDITTLDEFQRADVIHLHWVNQGYLSLNDIKKIMTSGKRVVITMHDQWYFTGVCHYSGDCEKYKTQCHHCELMNGTLFGDFAKQVFEKKKAIYSNTKLTFIGCSKWIADLARTSALTEGHKVINIPNAIDTELFQPVDKAKARENFNLPSDKRLLLFGSQRITDERKGFSLLVEALEIIKKEHSDLADQIELIVVGGDSEKVKGMVPFRTHSISYVSSPRKMVELYSAADIYVTPSLQDNLPNTIVESMACGIPCVGFKVGGIPEMIDHQQDGYVAEYKDSSDFAKGILWTLAPERYSALCEAARSKALHTYSQSAVAQKYIEAYEG